MITGFMKPTAHMISKSDKKMSMASARPVPCFYRKKTADTTKQVTFENFPTSLII